MTLQKKKESESDDFDTLQIARCPSHFDNASSLMIDKWKRISVELVQYFEHEWLEQNRNWYEGFMNRTPSTNNALESRNNVIKNEQTLRELYNLSQFRVVLIQMLQQWSSEYENGPNAMNFGAPTMKLNYWTTEYNFARSNVGIFSSKMENKIIYERLITHN